MNRRHFLSASAGLALCTALPALAQDRPEADAVAYESLDQLKAIAAKGPAIVYFHADWCPTCRATMVSLRGRWPEIQPGITLVIADYDAETELKARFGVTYQNTYVQVDRNADKLVVWNGGGIEALNTRPQFDY
ncbi:thioredoxin family protein [Devosia epidermidihirudinis]|uniref:thioredoxin family protein n=1 Tax=Devosia epidermidihirudinis TaxID=1293439 RepID=UPI0009E396AF|nr:thioredoxin family protein [Devosia epidermidihirudinis]